MPSQVASGHVEGQEASSSGGVGVKTGWPGFAVVHAKPFLMRIIVHMDETWSPGLVMGQEAGAAEVLRSRLPAWLCGSAEQF